MAGKYYDEIEIGAVYRHAVTRTVTEMDNVLFTTLTMNVQPLHLDAEFGKRSMFGQRLVNSIFTLGLVVGISVADTTLGMTVGNLGFDRVEFPPPCSTATPSAWRQKSWTSASRSRARTRAWSGLSIGATTSAANWFAAPCALGWS